MKFVELSVLTMIKPINGKGETKTVYCKKLINTAHILDILDDPENKDLMHISMLGGSKMVAEGSLKTLKNSLK